MVPRLAATLGLLIVLINGIACQQKSNPVSTSAVPEIVTKSVRVTIDFGDGFQRVYSSLACPEGKTVFAVMEDMKVHPHPTTFTYSGSGETAFLTEVEGVKNEGTGPDKKNWLCWVNGKFGDESFGVHPLMPGDEVLWKFTIWPAK